ncbi:MAG: SufD family Fe-S cluster assembly protein [Lachnospiraceae bacterium]|nr:SufD family Fe-S cluster assembly protein [Lachnospiraceae bacterium]
MKVQSSEGYTTINRVPSLTWNRLHLNEAEGAVLTMTSGRKSELTLPAGVSAEELPLGNLAEQKTGIGPEFAAAVKKANVSVRSLKVVSQPDGPIRMDFSYEGEVSDISPVEVEVADGLSVTVIMFYTGVEASGSAGVQTIYHVGKGASFNLVQVQKLPDAMTFFNDIGGTCEEGGIFRQCQLILSGGKSYYGSLTDLSGKASDQETAMAYLVGKDELLDINQVVNHIGKKTTCDIKASGVLSSNAKKNFRGTIDLRKGAKGAVGNENEEVLLLDEGVVNKTLPIILCTEEDVEGNHGASIGKLDSELMFYLESRGISEEEIYRMMARARIDAVKNRISDEETRQRIDSLLDA